MLLEVLFLTPAHLASVDIAMQRLTLLLRVAGQS
jgi:hypothetical protein